MAFLSGLPQALANCIRGCGCLIFSTVGVALFFMSTSPVSAQGAAPEYQVKAVFLFHLAQFVDWPPRAFPDPQSPLIIGVLGDDPFGPYLDETFRGEKVNNRSLQLQRYRRPADIRSCHVLFVSRSETDRLDQILAGLRGRSILTVSDQDNFINRGGMIGLVTERGKLRLRINLNAVRAANLTVSSKLLRLAETER